MIALETDSSIRITEIASGLALFALFFNIALGGGEYPQLAKCQYFKPDP